MRKAPLDCDIEIHASPRGKKTQRIHLLSSGERALVALSLLFGIFLTKPSPFCLLDEVDAPLDDANVGRFVKMLESVQDTYAVHRHHAQPATHDHRGRGRGVRRDDAGARCGFCSGERQDARAGRRRRRWRTGPGDRTGRLSERMMRGAALSRAQHIALVRPARWR